MASNRNYVVFFTAFCLFVVVTVFSITSLVSRHRVGTAHVSSPAGAFKAPKHNVWADLTKDEADSVYDFLDHEWAHLNLTKRPNQLLDNYVYSLEVLQPNKSRVLPYLWQNHDAPERWAKIALASFDDGEATLAYHAVGPLPISPKTRALHLTYPFNGRNRIRNPISQFENVMEFSTTLGENISDITTELLNAKINRNDTDDPDGLLVHPSVASLAAENLEIWIQFFRPGPKSGARMLLPQGIYAKIHASGQDAEPWTVGEWFYNGRMFPTLDDFRAGLREDALLRTPPNLDGPWTDTEDFDAQPQGRELPPPISVQPYGPRYRLDRTERFVSWFGFEFYLTFTQATGVSVYDVRFKGERVLYELGLQEALAHYSGDDPMAGSQVFLDTFFGMGTNAFELVPGYDCPAYADYLDSELHRLGNTETLRNNVCVFEFTSDYVLSRHTTQSSVTVSRNTFLTVRSVSTVGNYDYTIDYVFYLDGAIEVKVRASGFIYAAFYANNSDKNEDEYGHRIHDALSSSLHDHVISFKADLDVAGSSNELVRLAVEPATISYPWDQPSTKERNTMHLKEYPVEQETGLDWPKNSGQFYIVYSSDEKNAWGEKKGYRIVSGTGMGSTPHLTVLNSTVLVESCRWAERDLWVVRQKDHEPRGADPFNYLSPLEPLVNFANIADTEDLRHDEASDYDGDLVVYFNLGSHHVPHSGDVPNTLMHTSASSVMFVPHNFADRDPSRESVQGVRVQFKDKRRDPYVDSPPDSDETNGGDLRSREGTEGTEAEERHELRQGANYFGTPYTTGVELELGALDPDLEEIYQSKDIRVSDLGMNGSAAGMWVKEQ